MTYRRGGDELSLTYDLWNTEPRQRRFNGVAYEPPALSSPLGVQGDSGELQVGSARLTTEPRPVWLIAQEADPARRAWIAVNPLEQPTSIRLETPCGVVSAEQWGMGRLEWRAPVGGGQELHRRRARGAGRVARPGRRGDPPAAPACWLTETNDPCGVGG